MPQLPPIGAEVPKTLRSPLPPIGGEVGADAEDGPSLAMDSATPTFMTDEQWAQMTPGERARNVLQWGGKALASMFGMGQAGYDAVESPALTLATTAIPLAAQGVRAIPTMAKAGAQFQQVMSKAATETVDVGGKVGTSALRIAELGEAGATMPKVANKFLQRITDPDKGELTYKEARDFYSNISRLSAKDALKTSPTIKREITNLRGALDKAIEAAAAKGGEAEAYRQAMRRYAVAARIRSISRKVGTNVLKAAAAAGGATAAYQVLK